MKYAFAIDEQETIVNVCPSVVSKNANVYTSIPYMMKRMKKLYETHSEEMTLTECDGYIEAVVPREWINIKPKRKSTMTDEQKKVGADRLKALRLKKEEEQNDAT